MNHFEERGKRADNQIRLTPYQRGREEKLLVEKNAAFLGMMSVLMFVISFFLQNLIAALTGLINSDIAETDVFKEINIFLSFSLSLVIPFSLFGTFSKTPLKRVFKKKRVPFSLTLKSVFISLGAMVIGMYASMTAQWILGLFNVGFEASFGNIPKDRLAFIFYLLNMTAVPAIFEEIAFRGFVLEGLRKFGDGFALFVSSFLFALIHVTPDRFPHTFIAGLVLGYFVIFTGTVKTSIKIHFIYNLSLTLVSVLGASLSCNPIAVNLVYEVTALILGFISLKLFLNKYRGAFNLHRGNTVNPQWENVKSFLLSKGMIIYYVFISVMIFKSAVTA